MNIFYLHKDPVESAKLHCDKHVCKMIIEYAQMLSTAHRMLDGKEYISQTLGGRRIKRWKHPNSNMEGVLYKASHINHPSAIWVRDWVLWDGGIEFRDAPPPKKVGVQPTKNISASSQCGFPRLSYGVHIFLPLKGFLDPGGGP